MVRINLLPDWREMVRKMAMARELCLYSFMFLGASVIFCGYLVMSTMRW
jgi:hypothetical protein